MVTKTRETHIRQMGEGVGSAALPSETLQPRLRLEPNPTYYLRMARSYAFLKNMLINTVEDLDSLSGLSADGPRAIPLGLELENMRVLFYGLYFVSCEDIGMDATFLRGELVEPELYYAIAAAWLNQWIDDPDLATDTRVAVPVYRMPRDYTRYWCTLGVRPIKFEAAYVKPPSWRAKGETDWQPVPTYKLQPGNWVLLGDEFGEAEMRQDVLTRQELRSICDEHKTRAAILEHLNRQ
jgi:hypothetical protein